MKKIVVTAFALVALAIPTVALADVSDNGTTNDAYGYCVANHIANFNGDHNGIGWLRSTPAGKATATAGNRAPADPCVTSQGDYAPISNS